MAKKWFYGALIALIALCLALTVAHFIYDFIAYQNCSIIYFISKEL